MYLNRKQRVTYNQPKMEDRAACAEHTASKQKLEEKCAWDVGGNEKLQSDLRRVDEREHSITLT